MKKSFVVFVVLVLLSSFVSAQNDSSLSAEQIKDAVEFSGVGDRSNALLEKNIEIPENLQIITKVLFGLKHDAKVDFQTFVILIAILVIIFLVIKSVYDIIPFGRGNKSWILSFLTIILVGIAGGFSLIAGWFVSISYFFSILENFNVARLAISLVLIAGFYYLISKLLKILKIKVGGEEIDEAARDIGWARIFGKVSKDTLENEN